MNEQTIAKISEHYEHAKRKHPYFCDGLRPRDVDTGNKMSARINERMRSHNMMKIAKDKIYTDGCLGVRLWDTVLKSELWEIRDAINNDDTAHAVEECYDAIAVLLRIKDVLEGRQKLGK